MAAPATIDEFLDLVRKSGVADEKRLDGYVQKLRAANSLPKEPGKFAGLLIRDGYLTQFQAEHILRGKWKRFTIGKYKVLERLGSGGMGAVYLCEHKLMRRRVAVKVLPEAKAKDESSLKRFQREARAAAALDHPNIVHAYDIDQDEELHFLVMEYVDGASLQDIVKKSGPMEPLRAAGYIRQAALGLEHAHTQGLVHRDIKPGNILVDRSGTVKILDMGLARFFHDEDDNLTRKFDENVLGTADYLAPEQAVDSHDVDIRADIYSLGATIYYCLTGKPPFGEGTVAQKLIWHQTKQPKPLSQMRGDIPEKLIAIIEKMMAKDPAQRYQRPGEVWEALGALAGGPAAPPKTAEMPALSLAARTGPVDTEQATIVSQNVPQGPVSPSPRPAVAAVLPVSSRTSLKQAVSAQPATVPPPPRRSADHDETWAADTESPIAIADTERGGESKRIRKVVEQESLQRRRWIIYLAVVALIAVAVFVIAYIVMVPPPPPETKRDPVLRVSRDPKSVPAGNVYSSLQTALVKAGKNDTIEIWDTLIEENVTVDPKKIITTQVTLKAAPNIQVVWKSKDRTGKTPLLRLVNAKDFYLVGKGITMDGEISPTERVEDLMQMSFKCQGMILEDLQARNFSRSALAVTNCAGEEANPAKIIHLQAVATGAKKPEAMIRFSAFSNAQPRFNDHIFFDDTCQFLGLPTDKIIRIDDPSGNESAVNGPGVRLPPSAKPAVKAPPPTKTAPAKK